MSQTPLLDIDTLEPERQTVRIRTSQNREGKFYEIQTLDDLSLMDRARMGRLQKTMSELTPVVDQFKAGEIPDDTSIRRFEDVIDEFLGLAFRGLEPEIIACMKLGQKEALIGAFTQASPPETKAKMEAAAKEILESPSPGSKPPTPEVTPRSGSEPDPPF